MKTKLIESDKCKDLNCGRRGGGGTKGFRARLPRASVCTTARSLRREGGCSMGATPFIALNSDYIMATYFHGTRFLRFLVHSLKDSVTQPHIADTKGVSLGPVTEIRGHLVCCEYPA